MDFRLLGRTSALAMGCVCTRKCHVPLTPRPQSSCAERGGDRLDGIHGAVSSVRASVELLVTCAGK